MPLSARPSQPCPFCGSANIGLQPCLGMFYVVCVECSAEGPERLKDEDAIAAWNRRALVTRTESLECNSTTGQPKS